MSNCIRPSLLIALLATLLTTADAGAQQKDPMAGWPEWVQKAMKKESRKTRLRAIKTPDGAFKTQLPGKLSAPEEIEGGWYFQSDIKAGSPLECYIFTTAQDLATLTNLIAEINVDAVGSGNNGTVENRNIFHTDAGAINGMPYLALEWIYTIKSDSQTAVGFTKVRAAAKNDMGYACAHNFLGYRETFKNIFSTFVTNIEYEDTAAAPYYEEIATLDLNGYRSGIAYVAFSTDEQGDIKIYSVEAAITPVSAGTLKTSDSVTATYTTPEGELINTMSVNVENGEIVSNVSLQGNDAGNWVSSGTLQGKTIEIEIDGAISPTTEIGQMATTRELFAGTESSASMDVWVPDADPTRFLKAEIVRNDAEIEGQATLTLGPIRYDGRFDEHGNMIDAAANVGPATIVIQRAWSTGSLAR